MAAATNFELVLTAILAVMLIGSIVSRKARLPYTLILVFLGIVLAASNIATVTGIGSFYQTVLGNLFVGLVLPPLLFESMMNLRSSELRSAIRPAIVLATVGVVLSTIVGGLLLWKFANLPIYEAFLFSSLISPTDTASVLEIFKRLKVPRRLAALMDAEAAFNDATGVIVFTLILTSGHVVGTPLVPAVVKFAETFGGGILVGLFVGFGAEIISSLISDTLSETALSLSMVYGSYTAAVAFGFSGLVSVAVTGLYYGNLTLRTVVRPLSREQIKSFWSVIAFIANSVAFLFIGVSTDLLSLSSSILLILIAYGAVMVARIAAVFPIMTFFGRMLERSRRWQNVAVLGGMRGALSVALVISVSTYSNVSSYSNTLHAMVLGVVFISILIQGPLLSSYIKRNFEEEQENRDVEPSMRLQEVLHAIEELHRLRVEGKLSESEFAARLEDERDTLAYLLSEINSSLRTGEIMRSRAKDLYSSISSLSRTRAMEILKRHKADQPIDEILQKGEEKPKE